MNRYQEVYFHFLDMVETYEFLSFTDEELEAGFELKLKRALSKITAFEDVEMDNETGCFSRPLTNMEVTILAHGLLVEWLSQKVFSVQGMENHMSSKDFTVFSSANHLKEMRELHAYADKELHYLINQYCLKKFPFKVK